MAEESPETGDGPPAMGSLEPAEGLFKLWPPSEATRVAVVEKMAVKLSSACFESQKYGRIGLAEAQSHAKRIEEAAFSAAQEADISGEDGGSIVILVYAKHASQLMLETLRLQKNSLLEPVTPTAAEPEILSRDSEGVSSTGESKGNEEDAAHVEDRESMNAETSFDVSGGTRAFLTEESAEELLKPLLASGHSFTQVCLSNWSFGNGSAEVAARALSAAKDKLVDVNLADIVAGRPEAEALKAMTTISSALEGSKLKSLNLSDNALGEKGVRAFSSLLSSQSSLQALYFMNNGISEEAARAISELLPSAKELRTLRFHNNMSGDPGAEELAGVVKMAPLLEYFQMSSSRVGIVGGIALMEALRNGESLQVLDIRDNMYGPEGGCALAQTLRRHNLLTEVYLSDLGLEDEGALAVIKALSEGSSQVRVLELGGNEITEKSAPTLASCVRAMKLLTRLNLTENELKDKGAVTICSVLKVEHENLEELDLSVNELGRIGAVAAAQAVANKKGFKFLNLNGNQISDSGIEALKEVLSKSNAGPGVLGCLDDNEVEEREEDDEEEEQEDRDEDESEVAGISNLEVSRQA